MSCAKAQPTLATTKMPKPRYSGFLRPHKSASEPNSGWPTPRARKKAVRLACTADTGAFRLAPICGSAGRYISMANGPMADSSPRISTRRKVEGAVEDEEDIGARLSRKGCLLRCSRDSGWPGGL